VAAVVVAHHEAATPRGDCLNGGGGTVTIQMSPKESSANDRLEGECDRAVRPAPRSTRLLLRGCATISTLHIFAADELAKAGSLDAAREHAAYAAEELPGDEAILAWETNLGTDQAAEVNAWTIVVRPEPQEVHATNGGGDSDGAPSEGLTSDSEP
jgi:hypothetical protein